MSDKRPESRIPDFYKLSVSDRIHALRERSLISAEDAALLISGEHRLQVQHADKMIENVVGVMGLPVGLALNFLINGRDWVVPMVVEEPSIIAGLSSAAKVVRLSGGFEARTTGPILIGQVQITSVPDMQAASNALLARKQDILSLANALHPRMVARGGGARGVEVHVRDTASGPMLILHLLVDTRDAMGANLVNTMCEEVAPLAEEITGGKVFLRILSNLTDRCLVRARMVVPVANLAGKGFTGERVRDGVISASQFAAADPYRAATHNKGIMNGVDAVAIATGNDWRALEAAAHAYAARHGRYSALTRFGMNADKDLVGDIDMPMKVGIVGGSLQGNPTVALNLRLLGVASAMELSAVMGCIGLAQNFAALRALATEGIQRGHMSLHARSVVATAGAPEALFDQVVARLLASGDIKTWKAREIIQELTAVSTPAAAAGASVAEDGSADMASGGGKVILLGEHAVVYGRRALAAPIPLAIRARASEVTRAGVELSIARWGVAQHLPHAAASEVGKPEGYQKMLDIIFEHLNCQGRNLRIEVFPSIPRAMGLGSSAALAVAVIRALNQCLRLKLSDQEVNALAYRCEQAAHGTPSGIDNTMATYGRFISFQKQEVGKEAAVLAVKTARPLPVVLGMTGVPSLTVDAVQRIRSAWEYNKELYNRLFDQIDALAGLGIEAVQSGALEDLGELMNICQGYLNALQVSGPEIENLVQTARAAGALGAKLTGGGIGGSIIALCKQNTAEVAQQIRAAGYEALELYLE